MIFFGTHFHHRDQFHCPPALLGSLAVMGNRHSRSRRQRDSHQVQDCPQQDRSAPAAAGDAATSRRITLLHFNDVYNIEPAARDPVGGAARLCHMVKSMSVEQPLVVFSGDAFSPSMLSVVTLGAQMPPVLNKIGVTVACVGNHDLDFGAAQMTKLIAECKFPWLMSNALDAKTRKAFSNTLTTHLVDWHGIKVGFVGLIESEWLETLGAIDPQELLYLDFIEEGHRLAKQLKEQGAELLVAITHMRVPNDRRFAAECPEYHIVMGGHDHHYETDFVGPVLMVKSGTDFRELTKVQVELPGQGQAPKMSWTRLTVDSKVPEDAEVKEIVDMYCGKMAAKMEEVIGYTKTELDGRFKTVRTAESNLGNFVCDIMRLAMDADICLINGGSFRSDAIHPAGPFRLADLSAILPMMDTSVVIEVTAEQLLATLENSVSMYPKLEGRFCQVSGVSFAFDPAKPADSRVVADSVCVGGQPLEAGKIYKLLTKSYMAEGKDGFDMLVDSKVLVDEEQSVYLPTTVRNHFHYLKVLALLDPRVRAVGAARKWRSAAAGAAAGATAGAVAPVTAAAGVGTDGDGAAGSAASAAVGAAAGAAAGAATISHVHGEADEDEDADLDDLDLRSPPSRWHITGVESSTLCSLEDGHFAIAPVLDGRIKCVTGQA